MVARPGSSKAHSSRGSSGTPGAERRMPIAGEALGEPRRGNWQQIGEPGVRQAR